MAQADALSYQSDHDLGNDHDNEGMTVLPDSVIINFLNTELWQGLQHPTLSGPDLFKEFQYKGIIQDPKNWQVDDTDGTTLLYQEQQYVPNDIDLCQSIAKDIIIPLLLAILANLAPLCWYPLTTGDQKCELLSNNMLQNALVRALSGRKRGDLSEAERVRRKSQQGFWNWQGIQR